MYIKTFIKQFQKLSQRGKLRRDLKDAKWSIHPSTSLLGGNFTQMQSQMLSRKWTGTSRGILNQNKYGVQYPVSFFPGRNIWFPSRLDRLCWFVLFLSALSIRHKTIDLFIRLASCYSEAVRLLLEKGLAWIQVVYHDWQLHSLKPSSWFIQHDFSLLINTLQFPSNNYLWNFWESWSSKITASDLTSYWNLRDQHLCVKDLFLETVLLLFIWHIVNQTQTRGSIKTYLYSLTVKG